MVVSSWPMMISTRPVAEQAEDAQRGSDHERGDQDRHVEDQETTNDDAFGALGQLPGFTEQAADGEIVTAAQGLFDARCLGASRRILQLAGGNGIGIGSVTHDSSLALSLIHI